METDPKKAAKSMEVWMRWFSNLGRTVVDVGAPTMPGKIVNASGVRSPGAKPVTGYSIMQAANLGAALEIAKGSPQITAGGQVAVYELAPM